MCQDLALKYSNAEPEQLLGAIPIEEVAELMRIRITHQVRSEVECDLRNQIAEAEEQASEQEGRAADWQTDAEWLFRAITEALEQDWETAKETLKSALKNSEAG